MRRSGSEGGRPRRARTRPRAARRTGGRAGPISRRRTSSRRVERPDRERDGHRQRRSRRARSCASPTTMPAERTRARSGGARSEPVERVEWWQPQAEHSGVAVLQPALLPEVQPGEPGCEGQPRKSREHQPDVQGEQAACRVARRDAGAAAGPGGDEKRGGERHHGEAEQPVARGAAPDQVRADDEPDEEVERAGPGAPGKPVRCRGPARSEGRLREPADAYAPDAEPRGGLGPRRAPA